MAWTAEDRRRYAPAVQEMVRQGMLVRLAATIDIIDPPSRVGRPRLWSTLIMLQALWHLARDGCACHRACHRTRACGAVSRAGGCGRCWIGRSRSWSPPPPRGWSEASADGRDRRHAER